MTYLMHALRMLKNDVHKYQTVFKGRIQQSFLRTSMVHQLPVRLPVTFK